MTTHGMPSWFIPGISARPISASARPNAGELRRLTFELRLLLENSADIDAALDVVDEIERLLHIPPVPQREDSICRERPEVMALNTLLDEALHAAAPAFGAAGVILLRKHCGQADVQIQRQATLKLLEEVLSRAIAACNNAAGLRILRVRTRRCSQNLPELIVEHSGTELPCNGTFKSESRYVQVLHDPAEARVAVRFLRGSTH